MHQKNTIMSEVHCETLKKLHRAIQKKRRGMLTSGVVLIHDNAHPHTVAHSSTAGVFQMEVVSPLPLQP
jgi:hypothetical protein